MKAFRRASVAHASALVVAVMVSACAALEPTTVPPAGGLSELIERPAERALFEGMKAYDDGQYGQAEASVRRALNSGLRSGRDRASAYKILAFVTCTSERMAECEAAFRAARGADPSFQLTRSEAGHPLWGPVYRRVVP